MKIRTLFISVIKPKFDSHFLQRW